MKKFKKIVVWYGSKLAELPSYIFNYLFSWIYTTHVLRTKAAITPYQTVRTLLLHRSGINIGKEVYIHHGMLVVGVSRKPAAVTLADRAAIGPNVIFVTSSDPGHSRLMHHPEIKKSIVFRGPINVEEDAWIGAGCIILPNVTVGRGAIIGSGSVVTKNVPPYTTVVGIPARVIRSFSQI